MIEVDVPKIRNKIETLGIKQKTIADRTGMSYVDFGRFNTSRDYLVKVMRQKIEKEKSSLHIIKQEEKAVSVDKIAKHMAKILNEI